MLDWLYTLVPRLVAALFTMVGDAFLWLIEQVLALASTLINSFTGFDSIIATVGGLWDVLPYQAFQMIQCIGLTTAMKIIVAAIIVRIGLQLIPFTRLGS